MKIKQNNSIIPLKLLLLCFGESECIKWSSLFFGNSNGNLAFRQWLVQNWLILDSTDPILMFLYLYYCIMLKTRGKILIVHCIIISGTYIYNTWSQVSTVSSFKIHFHILEFDEGDSDITGCICECEYICFLVNVLQVRCTLEFQDLVPCTYSRVLNQISLVSS